MTLRTERIRTLVQVRAFVDGNEPADFEFADRTSAYAFVRRTLVRFEYHGHLRVDTVHLGDRERRKGIYLINVVDEVTQFQHLGAVPRITHHFLVPRLEALLSAFPFAIHAFHADNGSEYVNGRVAALLNQLHIGVFTKSRPRHPNDNALLETKNGSVVRKWLGHVHVPHALVPRVNAFLHDHLCPFLNFHRPCLFPTEVTSTTGRVRRRYRQQDVTTPHERFKAPPDAEAFLRPGVTLGALDQLAAATTDLAAAQAGSACFLIAGGVFVFLQW